MRCTSFFRKTLLPLALAVCLACPGPALAVSAWVADWDLANGLKEVQQGKFKDIVMFAAYFNTEGKPFFTPAMQRFLTSDASQYRNTVRDMYLSVVNDTVTAPGNSVQKDPSLVKRLMATEQSRAAHREDLLRLLKAGPFTGLEIDYERVDTDDWPVLLAFTADLHQRLAKQGIKLRVLLEPKQKYLKAVLPQGPEYVLMGYNLHGGHNGPGPKANGEFLRKLAAWCAHMPQKPGIALATGGFVWLPGKVVSLTESKAAAWAQQAGAEVGRDAASQALRFTVPDNSPGSPLKPGDKKGARGEVWYADGQTLAAWGQEARSLGFGPVSLWRLGGNVPQSLQDVTGKLP